MRAWDKTEKGKEWHKEYRKKWARENSEKIKHYFRDVREYRKKYYKKNRIRILAQQKKERIDRNRKAEEVFLNAHRERMMVVNLTKKNE